MCNGRIVGPKAWHFFPETAFGGVWRDRAGSCENSSGLKTRVRMIFSLPWHFGAF